MPASVPLQLERVNRQITKLQNQNLAHELERKALVREMARQNQTITEQSLMIRNQDLAAEAAATRDHHGEQASRAMEDDLADAQTKAELLEKELEELGEREAKKERDMARILEKLSAVTTRLERAEERERLLLEQLEEARPGSGQGKSADSPWSGSDPWRSVPPAEAETEGASSRSQEATEGPACAEAAAPWPRAPSLEPRYD